MGDKTQIHVQVDSETKAEWRAYAKEHPEIGNDSLSALIRRAVVKEVNGVHSAEAGGEVSIDLSDLKDRHGETQKMVAELRNVVDRMETRVSEVQAEVSASAAKQGLKERLYHALPPAKPFSEPWRRAKPNSLPKDDRRWEVAWMGTIDNIAVVARDAEGVIEPLLGSEVPTNSEEIRGETRYWLKEGEHE